jgi:flagellin
VADGGLSEIAVTVSRLRELAVQSASETLDDTSRSYLDEEAQELLNQLDATATNAIYGDESTLAYPGVDVGLVIDTSGSMFGEILRVKDSITDFQDQFVTARYNVKIGMAEYRNTADNIDNTVLQTNIGSTSLLDDLDNLTVAGGSVDPYAALTETTGITSIAGEHEPDTFSFRSGAIKVLILITDSKRQADFIAGSETQSDVGDWLAEDSFEVHAITPTSVAGDYSTITTLTNGSIHDIGNSGGSNIPTALDDIATSIIDQLDQAEPRTFHIGIESTDSIDTPFPLDMSVVGLTLSELDLSTVEGARTAIDLLDSALKQVSAAQSKVGGLQRRLESAMATQVIGQEAEARAISTIEDLDFARESSTLAAAQIRHSASITAMVQARSLDEDAARKLLVE